MIHSTALRNIGAVLYLYVGRILHPIKRPIPGKIYTHKFSKQLDKILAKVILEII